MLHDVALWTTVLGYATAAMRLVQGFAEILSQAKKIGCPDLATARQFPNSLSCLDLRCPRSANELTNAERVGN